jgi:MFS family permease
MAESPLDPAVPGGAAQPANDSGATVLDDPRQRRIVLIVVALALMMVISAVSGLNVALPDLARSTGATQSQLQWIVDAYTLVFAGLLLPAGALGDRFGRKGVLVTGLLVFGVAAAFALFIESPGGLVGLRAVMGIGAALVMPTTLSVITTSFPESERGRAVGVWVGVAGGGAVIGLFGSAILLEFYSWNSFFALNVLLAFVALAGTLRFVPASRDTHAPRLDPVGALLSLAGISALIYGIIEGPVRTWSDPLVILGLVGGAASLAGFVLWELRRRNPMLDPRLFRLRGFGTGALSLAAQFFAAFGFFFIVLQYLQFVVGRSPLGAAAAMLPMPLVLIPLARQSPGFAQRWGINRVGAAGLLTLAGGLYVITLQDLEFRYWLFVVGLLLFATGMALAGAPATTAITSSLPPTKQGVASAVNDTAREFGSALGIAVLGSVLNDRYRAGLDSALADLGSALPPGAADVARGSLPAAQAIAERLGAAGAPLARAADQAFVDATGAALATASGVLVLAAVYVFVRGPRKGADLREGR